jgi:PilZ domain
MSTHRRAPRAPLSVYLNKFVGDAAYMCRSANISEDGIFLARLIEPDLDSEDVSLEFALPGDSEILWVHGSIVRKGSHRACEAAAIRFTVIPDAYRRRIAAYVQKHDLGLSLAA